MERLLATAITCAPVQALALVDVDGRIVGWNDAAARVTGHAASDAIGRDLAWQRQDADAALRAAADAPVIGGSWRERADGRRFWCEAELYALRDDGGTLRGFAESFREATAEHDAIAELERRTAILDAISRSRMVIVISQDLDLVGTSTSPLPSGLGLAGYDDLIGRTDDEVLPPEIAGWVLERKREILRTGVGDRFDVPVPTPDGTRHFDTCAEPLRNAEGRMVGLVTISIDATAARAETAALRRSRARLEEAETIARIGSWEWDMASEEVTWSDGLFLVYGITREEFGRRYTDFRDLVHPDDRQRMDATIRRTAETGGSFDVEHRAVRPDGHVRHVRSRGEAIVDGSGRTVRMAGTSQDVTDARVAEDALQHAAETLTQGVADLHRTTHDGARHHEDLQRALTPRQHEVLALLADGLTNSEIASRLYLSEGTVKWHVRGILRSLHLANRSQAVARYLRTTEASR